MVLIEYSNFINEDNYLEIDLDLLIRDGSHRNSHYAQYTLHGANLPFNEPFVNLRIRQTGNKEYYGLERFNFHLIQPSDIITPYLQYYVAENKTIISNHKKSCRMPIEFYGPCGKIDVEPAWVNAKLFNGQYVNDFNLVDGDVLFTCDKIMFTVINSTADSFEVENEFGKVPEIFKDSSKFFIKKRSILIRMEFLEVKKDANNSR